MNSQQDVSAEPVGADSAIAGENKSYKRRLERSVRVLALVTKPLNMSPAQRFRIEQWAPKLKAMGVQIEFEPFISPELAAILYQPGKAGTKAGLIFEAFIKRARCLRHVREFDLVYVLRETALLGPALFERWLKIENVPYVFDFDDAIFLPNASDANRAFAFLKFPGKAATACRMAAHVMAGNEYLADYARRFNPRVTVVPTTIDTEKYRPPQPRWETPRPRLVWTGSTTTLRYLENVMGALVRLRKRHDFTLRVIGAQGISLPGIDVENLPWSADTEALDLHGAWAGLMPAPDDAWARGKCGCKALQYMAVGVPAVCSPVGMNAQLIRDGENGLLASTEEDWVEKLTMLINSEELRRRLGIAGRRTVEAWYSAEVQAPRVYGIFASVTNAVHPEFAEL
ncbi:MAG TPA: glycosyltransferase family 4 protein [Terriglobia bacterium]|nr:glycosyltransferase family 4 protein [Terriglobia bacterium]